MSIESFVIRRSWSRNDKKRDEGLVIPEDVTYIRDLRYGKNRSL